MCMRIDPPTGLNKSCHQGKLQRRTWILPSKGIYKVSPSDGDNGPVYNKRSSTIENKADWCM